MSSSFFSSRVRQIICVASLFLLQWTEAPVRAEVDLAQVEVDGLLLDRTLTRAGHDFFRTFVARLGAADTLSGVNIVIREKVSAQWGSLVTVEVNDEIIFSAPLRPKGNGISELAEEAAAATANYLAPAPADHLDGSGEDVGEDELEF